MPHNRKHPGHRKPSLFKRITAPIKPSGKDHRNENARALAARSKARNKPKSKR